MQMRRWCGWWWILGGKFDWLMEQAAWFLVQVVCSWSKWNLNGLYRSKVEAKSRRKVWLTGGTGRLHHNCQGRPRLFLSPTCELHSSHYAGHCHSVIMRHDLNNQKAKRKQHNDKHNDKHKDKYKEKDKTKVFRNWLASCTPATTLIIAYQW